MRQVARHVSSKHKSKRSRSEPHSSSAIGHQPPPLAPVASLPLDILSLIFAYLPFRGRVHLVSVVCKRWRQAVHRTLTSFAAVLNDYVTHISARLARFPALRDLSLRSGDSSNGNGMCVQLPNTVTSVTLTCDAGSSSVHFAAPLPQLARITFIGNGHFKTLLPLLRASENSLTSLDLEADSLQAVPYLSGVHFPSLTSLRIKFVDNSPQHTKGFVSRHASQLISLSIHYLSSSEDMHNVHFPRLSKLGIGVIDAGKTSDLLLHCPSLTHLSIENGNNNLHKLRPSTLLTAVRVLNTLPTLEPPLEILALLPNLTVLRSPRRADLEAIVRSGNGHLLRSFSIGDEKPSSRFLEFPRAHSRTPAFPKELLGALCNVESLTVHDVSCFPLTAPWPTLREVELAGLSVLETVMAMRNIAALSPCLGKIRIKMRCPRLTEMADVKAAITEVSKRGVVLVHLELQRSQRWTWAPRRQTEVANSGWSEVRIDWLPVSAFVAGHDDVGLDWDFNV